MMLFIGATSVIFILCALAVFVKQVVEKNQMTKQLQEYEKSVEK